VNEVKNGANELYESIDDNEPYEPCEADDADKGKGKAPAQASSEEDESYYAGSESTDTDAAYLSTDLAGWKDVKRRTTQWVVEQAGGAGGGGGRGGMGRWWEDADFATAGDAPQTTLKREAEAVDAAADDGEMDWEMHCDGQMDYAMDCEVDWERTGRWVGSVAASI